MSSGRVSNDPRYVCKRCVKRRLRSPANGAKPSPRWPRTMPPVALLRLGNGSVRSRVS